VHEEICETNYQEVRAKRLASAWQLKMSSSFSRELEQYSYNDLAASLVAFGETSISTCNDNIPRKQPPSWATPQTSKLVPTTKNTILAPKVFTVRYLYWKCLSVLQR